MKTYELVYGTVTVGKFDGRYRRDTYTRHEDGVSVPEPVFATGPADQSKPHNSAPCYGGEYNPKCSSCWLGFPHSEEYHREQVAKAG